MAKDAKKVKTKAKINWGWDSPDDRNGKATRSTNKKSNKSNARVLKGLGFKAMMVLLLVTIIGGAIGVGGCWYVCKDDCFDIVGKEEFTIPISTVEYVNGDLVEIPTSYFDEGVKVVSFGRDISDSVYVETDLKQNQDGSYYADEVGTYYIIYKTDDIKYGKIFTVERIRLITFVEGTPDIIED